jgi:hypothetical protein
MAAHVAAIHVFAAGIMPATSAGMTKRVWRPTPAPRDSLTRCALIFTPKTEKCRLSVLQGMTWTARAPKSPP